VTVPAVIPLLRIISSLLATAASNPAQSVTAVVAATSLVLKVVAKNRLATSRLVKIIFFICLLFK